ncbi:MAG: hypothetical protein GWN00_33605, partial [Aliifodinibius sp.]|nr:hypothetical protein [Fodinibius sp.]NIU28197.1 hypothetical protein [candidate division KSB1 bacterium]NIV02376.1 hypothetical protein [Phycisphaerae bacterium]NIV69404.1 hypothetical protein [Phycisphaerae bacterium]NIY29547.1 hypothetical protein [Fodinibius sp.]
KLLVEGHRLNPDWVRIDRGQSITIQNNEDQAVVVVNNSTGMNWSLSAGTQESITFADTGIYQFFVETDSQTRSSFVIVEPVEDLP